MGARLLLISMWMNIKKIIEYRKDFLIGVIPLILGRALGIVFITLIFNSVVSINGWKREEILFIYGFYLISSGVHMFIFQGLKNLKGYFFSGYFETLMLRPQGILLSIVLSAFNEYALGEILMGWIVAIYSLNSLNIKITLLKIVFILIFSTIGSLILGSFTILGCTFLFYSDGTFSPLTMFTSLEQFAKYPVNIYGGKMKFILTYVLPLGFVSFYPASYILRGEISILWTVSCEILISFTMLFLSKTFFEKSLRRYKGIN